jgi:hypothetical protein
MEEYCPKKEKQQKRNALPRSGKKHPEMKCVP